MIDQFVYYLRFIALCFCAMGLITSTDFTQLRSSFKHQSSISIFLINLTRHSSFSFLLCVRSLMIPRNILYLKLSGMLPHPISFAYFIRIVSDQIRFHQQYYFICPRFKLHSSVSSSYNTSRGTI